LPPLDGSNFSAPSTATFSTPWIVVVGGRFQATPQLTLNAQIERFGWSEYDHIDVRFAGQTVTVEQRYDDTTSIAVGADYQVRRDWTVRAGVKFDPTPTPDNIRETGVPDSDRWTYAAGTSLQLKPGLSLDAALAYVAFDGDRISDDAVFYAGTPAQTTARLRGKVDGDAKVVSVGLRWKF
jgi:long-chain fatty acid transport protein